MVTRLISATGSEIEKMSPMELKESLNTHFPQVIVRIKNDSFNFLGTYE